MAEKHYVGELGTDIIVDCGCDISGATALKLKVKKPDDSEAEWPSIIEGTNSLKYTIQAGDFSLAGQYLLQASLSLSGWSGLGETTKFIIYSAFK